MYPLSEAVSSENEAQNVSSSRHVRECSGQSYVLQNVRSCGHNPDDAQTAEAKVSDRIIPRNREAAYSLSLGIGAVSQQDLHLADDHQTVGGTLQRRSAPPRDCPSRQPGARRCSSSWLPTSHPLPAEREDISKARFRGSVERACVSKNLTISTLPLSEQRCSGVYACEGDDEPPSAAASDDGVHISSWGRPWLQRRAAPLRFRYALPPQHNEAENRTVGGCKARGRTESPEAYG